VSISLQSRLYALLDKEPEARAIAFYTDHGNYSWQSREQLHHRAAGYAARLRDYGLNRGDTCVLVLPSGEYCAAMIVAILLLGAVPLLMAPPVLRAQAAYSNLIQILNCVIRKTRPRVVVCPESMANLRENLEKGRPSTRFLFGEGDVAATPVTVTLETPAETDVAAMQLTSGTTGFPRVCVWKQKGVLAALDGMATAMKLREEDICLNWTPLYHDMGLVNNFFLCLTGGVPLVMLSPLDFVKTPALWLRALSQTGATITWSPNFGFAISARRVQDDEMEGVRLDGVRAFWNAAERIHAETMHTFHERFAPFGVRLEALKTNYGCAENVGGSTFSDPDGMFVVERIDRSILQEKGIAQPVADSENDAQTVVVVGVGRPHPAVRIEILSRAGRPLPSGHIGEVALETASRMVGYLKDAHATRRAIYGNLLRTGDLGYLRDGELFWVGRVRERITVRGIKLDPSDFEPILLQIPGLRHGNFAAFGVDNEEQGTQRIVIISEVRDSTSRSPEQICDEIRSGVFQRLGVNVSDIVLVRPGTLSKTSSGKRRHRYFQSLYMEGKLKRFEWKPE
jgi:fatty-acyl-CoA synthase